MSKQEGQGEVRPGVQAEALRAAVKARNTSALATRQMIISKPLAEVRDAAKRAIQERLNAVTEQKRERKDNVPDQLPVVRALSNLEYLNDLGTNYPEFREYLRRAGGIKLTGWMCMTELYLSNGGVMFTHASHCGYTVASPLTTQRLYHAWENGWNDNSLNKLAILDEEGILKRLARGIR